MGENEQGGMLRTVIVIGLIALIAAVIALGIIGLKSNMTKNTDSAIGTVVTTKKSYSVKNPDVTYKKYTPDPSANWGWGHGKIYFPVVGDIPNNSWREDRLVVNASERIYIHVDISDNPEVMTSTNDNDDISKRLFEIYDENGKQLVSTNNLGNKVNDLGDDVYLDKDKDYTIIVKYFNNSGQTFIERAEDDHDAWRMTILFSGTDDGREYRLKVKSFEAATYDDKYNK